MVGHSFLEVCAQGVFAGFVGAFQLPRVSGMRDLATVIYFFGSPPKSGDVCLGMSASNLLDPDFDRRYCINLG